LVANDSPDTVGDDLTMLSWAAETEQALARYRQELPSPDALSRVDSYQVTPSEMLANPHLRIRAIETELAHLFRNFVATLEQTLDEPQACKVAYAAGLAHGKRRLSTFLDGQSLQGGPKTMAMWQDTAHSSAGPRHTSALVARYDNHVVEVSRTEDSFGSVGEQSPAMVAYFDGFADGYTEIDPQLSYVEELVRKRSDGRSEFVTRFWYEQEQ
jgi:hypothetical protein